MNEKLKELIPGLAQGIVRVGVSYPFDAIKVYMQKGVYVSTWDCLKNINLKVLYRGSQLSFILIPIDRSFQYFLAEDIKKKYNSYIAGFVTGGISSVYQVPLQYITTNALLTQNYKNIWHFTKNTQFKNLYKGYNVELVRCLMASTIYLGSYMHIRDNIDPNKVIYLSPFIGGVSSIITWLTVFPLDTIRTQKQTSQNTIMTIIKELYKQNGVKRFYLGVTPILIRTIPSSAFGMFIYEFVKKIIAV